MSTLLSSPIPELNHPISTDVESHATSRNPEPDIHVTADNFNNNWSSFTLNIINSFYRDLLFDINL